MRQHSVHPQPESGTPASRLLASAGKLAATAAAILQSAAGSSPVSIKALLIADYVNVLAEQAVQNLPL